MFGQTGDFFISNYKKENYKAGLQNWGIETNEKGQLFVGNNDGLLINDGENWSTHPVSNKTIVRSLLIIGDTIFVGAQNEFGFFLKTGLDWEYHSLKNKNTSTSDIWRIHQIQNKVYFSSIDKIITYDLKTTKTKVEIDTDEIINSWVINNQLWLQRKSGNLFKLNNNQLINCGITIKDKVINGFEKNNTLSFFSQTAEIHHIHNKVSTKSKIDEVVKINQAILLKNGSFALTSPNNGIILIDSTFKSIEYVNSDNGLLSDNVLCISEDKQQNLWAGLNDGIGHLLLNYPFRKQNLKQNQPLTGYASCYFKNAIYFGTTDGLFKKENESITKIKNSEGQVWGLNIVNDQLFMAHSKGAFLIDNDIATAIDLSTGYWLFQAISGQPNLILCGTYRGLIILEQNNNGWNKRTLEGFKESSRFLEQDLDGKVWVAHPYKGVFNLSINFSTNTLEEIKVYDQSAGFPSNISIYVFKIRDEIIFTAEKGIYRFSKKLQQFELHPDYLELFPKENRIDRIYEDKKGTIWYASQNEIGQIAPKINGLKTNWVKLRLPPLKENLVGGFENINPYDDQLIHIATEEGFLFLNKGSKIDSQFFSIPYLIDFKITNQNDEHRAFDIYMHKDVPASVKSCHFKFGHQDFSFYDNILFQTKLIGFEESWTNWSSQKTRTFNNLPPGNYRFLVRNNLIESKHLEVNFTVLPPWYKNKIAYSIYTLLVIMALIALLMVPKKQYEKEKEALELQKEAEIKARETEHKKAINASEKEISKLKNEKLQTEIDFKNRTLAANTMHLAQKNELIQNLQLLLKKLEKMNLESEQLKIVKEIKGMIRDNDRLEDNWNQFEFYFDQVHTDFFQNLKIKFPALSSKDHQLCAYLRMNLSSKEIAPLLNVSVRGVEISRYRLRKKLNLKTEEKINTFLMNI